MTLSELLQKAQGFAMPLRLLGFNPDKVSLRHMMLADLPALDGALDHLDDLATKTGAECALVEIEIEGKRATAFVVFSPEPIAGEIQAGEPLALPQAEKSS